MPKLFIAGIALFLLLGAGYGLSQAARSIPWDCADWQPFAHEDRTTAILETLAENRGKTLYCGIDQSDTFGKAETWAAGKDRNERDDTVYWGERGSFRGFIAAQEGWLTDGESGITGQSIATIFEFPKEEQRGRRKKVKRIDIGTDPAQFPITAVASCGQILGLICNAERYGGPLVNLNDQTGLRRGRNAAAGAGHSMFGYDATDRWVTWDTNLVYQHSNFDRTNGVPTGSAIREVSPNTAWWLEQAAAAADRACRDQGYRYAAGSAQFGPGHSNDRGSGTTEIGRGLGLFQRAQASGGAYTYPTRQSRTWSATCKKVIRGSRR